MCIFADSVSAVRKTRIFVSLTNDDRQLTVYENYVAPSRSKNDDSSSDDDSEENKNNAMILPCPLSSEVNDVILLDLSDKKGRNFTFDGLKDCFPTFRSNTKSKASKAPTKGATKGDEEEDAELEVIEVGAYKVSVAPSVKDIRRANKDIFKLSKGTRKVLEKEYNEGFAFVICMFDTTKEIDPHPVGYIHDPLPSGDLFVPCKHVHDEKDHKIEKFDHVIYSLDAHDEKEKDMESVSELTEKYIKREKKGEGRIILADVTAKKYLSKTQLGKYLSFEGESELYRLILVGGHNNQDMIFTLDDSTKTPAAAVSKSKSKSRKQSKKGESDDD